MAVMSWCVMPEVLYVQSLPSSGRDVGASSRRLRVLGPAPKSWEEFTKCCADSTWSFQKEH